MAKFDSQGRQIPDPRPVEVPVGFGRPLTLQEEMKRFIRQEISMRAQAHEMETFEEADDFEVEDEDDLPDSPYEMQDMVPEAGDKDGDPPPDPKARPPGKIAEGGASVSGGEGPPVTDEEKEKADSPSKS